VDTYLNESLTYDDRLLIDKPLLKGHGPLFQYDFVHDFQNRLQFIKSTRQIQKKVQDKYADPSDVGKEGGNLVNSMATMFLMNVIDLSKL
jgi:5,10-methylenetetrahydrofolate reductase